MRLTLLAICSFTSREINVSTSCGGAIATIDFNLDSFNTIKFRLISLFAQLALDRSLTRARHSSMLYFLVWQASELASYLWLKVFTTVIESREN